MIKDRFKEALADILYGETIDKLVRESTRRNRRRLRAFEQAVKDLTHMDRRNVKRMSAAMLISSVPTTELWEAIMYRMIALEARDRVIRDGEDVP